MVSEVVVCLQFPDLHSLHQLLLVCSLNICHPLHYKISDLPHLTRLFMFGLVYELKLTALAITALSMVARHCQALTIGIQPYNHGSTPEIRATLWLILATASRTVQSMHGELHNMRVCVVLGKAPCVFWQN